MKTNKMTKRASLVVLVVAAGLSGCSHTAQRLQKVSSELEEESRALTSAVVETLDRQPTQQRDLYSTTALEFAKQGQRIEGLPTKPFDVPALLTEREWVGRGSSRAETNEAINPARQEPRPTGKVGSVIASRFARQNKLLAEQRRAESKLIALGAAKEAQDNARKKFWAKWISAMTLPIGGIIALCVFFPVAIPFVGRILGWLVSKIPGLAGWIGVVSVKAFDAVVQGIEKTKQQTQTFSASAELPGRQVPGVAPSVLTPPTALNNEDSRRHTGTLSLLETNLSRAMDAAHKKLVRARRNSQLRSLSTLNS